MDIELLHLPTGGWQVKCSEHGFIGNGFAYETEDIARRVRTRHRNRSHPETAGDGPARPSLWNRAPAFNWQPVSIEDAAWVRAEAQRRKVRLAIVLDEMLTEYCERHDGSADA